MGNQIQKDMYNEFKLGLYGIVGGVRIDLQAIVEFGRFARVCLASREASAAVWDTGSCGTGLGGAFLSIVAFNIWGSGVFVSILVSRMPLL